MPPTDLLQVRTAARELGVHENTLRRWESAGFIRAVRLPSGVRRFRADDVARLRDEMYAAPEEHERAAAAALGTSRARG
ncbi:MAG TPA: MerR family DNA-binding transcriptional regulator [Solirubrobacteraceae bacterium]|jgi:excisionase family DNA binding protein|nr:MerR family DNA-binding transcriptional regulator [Solirubrobacteraceae bacterium]